MAKYKLLQPCFIDNSLRPEGYVVELSGEVSPLAATRIDPVEPVQDEVVEAPKPKVTKTKTKKLKPALVAEDGPEVIAESDDAETDAVAKLMQ